MSAIIITLAIVIGFPVAALAVTGSNVFVTDAVSGKHAYVSASGQLSVAATGSVTATPTSPSAIFDKWTGINESGGCNSVTPTVPAGKALIVTSITVDVVSVTTGNVQILPVPATPGPPCVSTATYADVSQVSGGGVTEVISFPQGYPIKAGHLLGMFLASVSGDAFANVTVKGYMVSSALCTVSGPPIGCN